MFKKILIIGCGLIGSSILKCAINKKLSKKIFVLEKNKKYRNQIKKINNKIILINKLDKNIPRAQRKATKPLGSTRSTRQYQ